MVEITAKIHLLPMNEGGRKSFVFSGYRPNLRFGKELYTDAAITFSDREKLFPGETWQVTIHVPKPEFVQEYLKVGKVFDIHEGSRKVGNGEILAVS